MDTTTFPEGIQAQRDFIAQQSMHNDFDRAWVLTLLNRVMQQLGSECDEAGRGGNFLLLRPYLQGADEVPRTAEIGERMGLSENAVRSLIFRLRTRLRELVVAEVRHTVASAGEVQGELRSLISLFES